VTVDDLLERARSGLERLTPAEALAAAAEGAVIVDVRSPDEQAEQGALIPGALHYPLSVVLWRLDPDAPAYGPRPPLETQVILACRHGYSSSLAAAQLREIGFARATDVIGGVEAWVAAGLPVDPIPAETRRATSAGDRPGLAADGARPAPAGRRFLPPSDPAR
jgi:rhodanese-related sulfurtransferase